MSNNKFITDLQAQRANLLEQIKLIESMLKLNGVDITEEAFLNGDSSTECPYRKGASYQEKLVALLKMSNRFLSINEMANMVHEFEPKIKIEEAKKGLGSSKNLLLKANSIVKVQVGSNNSNSFYGSPAWIDEQGLPKDEFKYNESALQLKVKVEI